MLCKDHTSRQDDGTVCSPLGSAAEVTTCLLNNIQSGGEGPLAWYAAWYRRPAVEAVVDVVHTSTRRANYGLGRPCTSCLLPDKRRVNVQGSEHDGRTRCTWMGTNLVECQLLRKASCQMYALILSFRYGINARD